MMTSKATGDWGERTAEAYLRQEGYQVIDRNWHARQGELDIIARQGDQLVFVEVKTRGGNRFGSPEQAVTPAKQRSLQRACWRYLMATGQEQSNWRIDVIAIERGRDGQVARLDHYPNAVQSAGDLDK